MPAADAAQTAGEQHQSMLQISLAPAAVATGVFDHRLGGFLVTSLKIWRKPDLPVRLEQQRGLHKIMAEYVAAEWFASRQPGQITKLHERFGAYDGVMSPIV